MQLGSSCTGRKINALLTCVVVIFHPSLFPTPFLALSTQARLWLYRHFVRSILIVLRFFVVILLRIQWWGADIYDKLTVFDLVRFSVTSTSLRLISRVSKVGWETSNFLFLITEKKETIYYFSLLNFSIYFKRFFRGNMTKMTDERIRRGPKLHQIVRVQKSPVAVLDSAVCTPSIFKLHQFVWPCCAAVWLSGRHIHNVQFHIIILHKILTSVNYNASLYSFLSTARYAKHALSTT